MLLKIYDCLDFSNSLHTCIWAVMLFMFFSFFRVSNVLPVSTNKIDMSRQVTTSDIIHTEGCLLVSVTWSKTGSETIQYKERCLIIPLSSVPGSVLCPVRAYQRLLDTVKSSQYQSPFCYYAHGNLVLEGEVPHGLFNQVCLIFLSNCKGTGNQTVTFNMSNSV